MTKAPSSQPHAEHEPKADPGAPRAAVSPAPPSVLEELRRIAPISRVDLPEDPEARVPEALLKPIPIDGSVPRAAGRYQLLSEIARGGVGIIVRGHDVDLGRDVAVKLLQERFESSSAVVQRFVEEAQLGGQLQHPGIVPVYELGMHGGRPFFAMKLVKGRTLASILSARSDLATDRAALLSLFERVCQTIAYAHSRGVIHRDLKPANVMAGSFGEVQVVDWGMAKVLKEGGVADERKAAAPPAAVSVIETVRSQPGSSGSQSLEGAVMGTPAYMPPEQALGRVESMDRRSDVFSLGAILCEILTGEPPYADPENALILAASCQTQPALEALERCGADSAWIALASECLRADPRARPAHAGVVAERVHAELVTLETRARAAQVAAAEARVRAEDSRRAQRLTLAFSTVIVLALLGSGGAWIAMESQREQVRTRDRTAVQRAMLELERKHAAVLAAGDDAEAEWAAILANCTELTANLEHRELDAEARAEVDAKVHVVRSDAAAARTRAERADADTRMLARLQDIGVPNAEAIIESQPGTDGGELPARIRSYDAAFRDYGIAVDAGSEAEVAERIEAASIRAELCAALDDWAMALRASGAEPASVARLLSIARLSDREDPWRSSLRNLLSAERASLEEMQRLVAAARRETLAPVTWLVLGQALDALEARAEVVKLYRAARAAHPGHFRIALQLARAHMRCRPPQLEEAVAVYREARAMRPDDLIALHGHANALMDVDRDEEALELLREEVRRHPDYALAHRNLAVALTRRGEYAAAEVEIQRALELRPGFAPWITSWAWIASKTTGSVAALGLCDRALEIEPALAFAHNNRGAAFNELGEDEAALECFRRAVACDASDVLARLNLAERLREAGDRDGARLEVSAAEPLARSSTRHWRVARAWRLCEDLDRAASAAREAFLRFPSSVEAGLELALQLRNRGEIPAAREVLLQVLGRSPHSLAGLTARAEIERLAGDFESAERVLLESVVLAELASSSGEDREHAAKEWIAFLEARCGAAGAVDEARRLAARHTSRYLAQLVFGMLLCKQGDCEAALGPLSLAVQLDPQSQHAKCVLAAANIELGRAPEALAIANEVVDSAPRIAIGHWHRGRALLQLGHAAAARDALARACALARRGSSAHAALSAQWQAQGGREAAIEHWRTFLSARPLSPWAWLNLGRELSENGEPQRAVEAYTRALALEPEEWTTWNNLAAARLALGEIDAARDAAREAIRLSPLTALAHFVCARVERAAGNHDAAEESYRRACELASEGPSSPLSPVVAARELDLFWKSRFDDSQRLAAWRGFVEKHPRHTNALLRLASMHADLNDLGPALELARRAYELEPANHAAQNDYGYYLVHAGRSAEALPLLRAAVKSDPRFALSRANLARALAQEEQRDEAIVEAVEALRLDPRHEWCWASLNAVLDGSELEEARRAFVTLAERAPQDPETQFRCAMLLARTGREGSELAEPRAARAVELRGSSADHGLLGEILWKTDRNADAEVALRRALELDPKQIAAHHFLGHVRDEQGYSIEGLAEVEKFNEQAEARGAATCEHMQELTERADRESRRLALLAGKGTADAHELLVAAKLGYDRGRHLESLELARRAFELEPAIAGELDEYWRYNAACSAALAAADLPAALLAAKQRSDADPNDRCRELRNEALHWLRADFELRKQSATESPDAAKAQVEQLRWWLEDSDLASLRDVDALPEPEREPFRTFWSEVRATIERR